MKKLMLLLALATGCNGTTGQDAIRLTRAALRIICAFASAPQEGQTVEVTRDGNARLVRDTSGGSR